MRTPQRTARMLAMAAASGLVLAACGGGGSDDSGSGSGGQTGGEITARGCQPQNPLVGGDTGETCGHDIVELTTSTLFRYDPETIEPVKDLAESVETEDNQNFTVKIRQGAKFHDGTEVRAKNFVDGWNYTAYGPNAQYLSYFMEPIEGYADLQGDNPKSKEMAGLAVVDDYTFTIKTTDPVSNLPIRLGYTAFAPLPDSFLANPEEGKKKPVGAGPYQLEEYSQGQRAVLTKFADYGGAAPAGNLDKITFRVYGDTEAAYNDLLANNLDTIDEMPASAMIDKKYASDLGDRWMQEPYPATQTVTFPPAKVAPQYADPKVRHAISMAIDRQKIIDDHFDGAREVATGWAAPGVEGYKEGACGEFCDYNPDKAKALLAEAGGFDGKMGLGYNSDSDHKAWTTATCNSIRDALGVDCVATPTSDFATFRDLIKQRKMTNMFRSGWIADYPHIENFLTPVYATGASSNDGDYSNPAFDGKLKDAAKAEGDEALKLYQEAEDLLAEDMPSIPMWYYTATVGYSDKVTDVRLNKSSGRVDMLNLKVK